MSRISLRRYSVAETVPCPGGVYSYHNAERLLGDMQNELVPVYSPDMWPTKCDGCDYEFNSEDIRHEQVFKESLYRRSDTGTFTVIRSAPVGAMWYADWLTGVGSSQVHRTTRNDGPHLLVKTPGGQWDIDSWSTNGDGWERSGTPPLITASPSILIPDKYHGWLRDGVLTEA